MARPFTLRHLLLALAFAVLDVVGHVLGPRLRYPDPSPLLAHPALMKAVALSLLVIAFSVAVLTFLRLEPGLPGRHGAGRGLRFGLAWVGFWLVGGLEMPLLSGGNFSQELYTAAVDCTALLGLLVVVGAMGGRRDLAGRPPAAAPGLAPVVLVIAAAGLGRVLANALDPLPGVALYPAMNGAAALAWPASVGGVYLALRPALGEGPPWRRAGRAALAFGASAVLGLAFVPIFTRVSAPGYVARVLVLVAAAALGFLGAEVRARLRGIFTLGRVPPS